MSEEEDYAGEDLTENERIGIALGEEAKIFLSSTLGVYLKDMAAFHIQAAKDSLALVDPKNSVKIEALQNTVKRHEEFDQWIFDLIQNGDATYEAYLESLD
jgi:hypothetical protein